MWALALLCLIWGLNWVVMKQANQYFPPIVFTTYRFLVGAAILLGVSYFKNSPLPRRSDWKWIISCGLLQIAFFNGAVQIGMQYLGAGFSAVLSYSMPFWVAIMAHFFLGERLTTRKLSGVCLGMLGLGALLNVNINDQWWAIVLTLLGAVAWGLSSVIVKWKLKHCNILQFTAWQMAAGSAALAAYSVLTGYGEAQWGWQAIGCLVYNGVLASALAFFLWTYILSTTEAGKASVSVLAIPIIGVLAGVILLGEPLYWSTILGMALIISGIWLVNNSKKADASKQDDKETVQATLSCCKRH